MGCVARRHVFQSFSPAQEAEYPTLLCERIAVIILQSALERGFVAATTLGHSSHLQLSSMALHLQPTKSMPQYLTEFAYVTEVLVTKDEPVLDHKGKLTKAFQSVPVGAKRFKTVRTRVGNDTGIFYDVWGLQGPQSVCSGSSEAASSF